MQRSPSTPSENFEEELHRNISDIISNEVAAVPSANVCAWIEGQDDAATKILEYLRSKGVINNG